MRVARALGELVRVDAAFAAGKLSYSKVHEGKLEFKNRCGRKLDPVPARDEDLDAVERWLQHTEPGFDHAGTPVWDGSRLHLADAVNWLCSLHANS